MNNVVGKILIVMQLVFSLCFMCFAGAAYTFHAQWKTKASDLEGKLKNAQTQIQQANDARTNDVKVANDEKVVMEERAKTAEARLVDLETTLKQVQGLLANAEQQRDKAMAELVVAQQESESRVAETSDSRSEIKRLRDQMNAGIAERRTLEDQLLDAKGRLEDSVERERQNVLVQTGLREKLRHYGHDPDEPIDGIVPPPVERVRGLVVKAAKNESRSAEHVQISIGSDDKVARNMKLIVSRGSRFICEIIVTDVTPDSAVGRVIEETRNGSIERGDNVTTKL